LMLIPSWWLFACSKVASNRCNLTSADSTLWTRINILSSSGFGWEYGTKMGLHWWGNGTSLWQQEYPLWSAGCHLILHLLGWVEHICLHHLLLYKVVSLQCSIFSCYCASPTNFDLPIHLLAQPLNYVIACLLDVVHISASWGRRQAKNQPII
jgi:hypothetical protein